MDLDFWDCLDPSYEMDLDFFGIILGKNILIGEFHKTWLT